jgi:hypothetical protein
LIELEYGTQARWCRADTVRVVALVCVGIGSVILALCWSFVGIALASHFEHTPYLLSTRHGKLYDAVFNFTPIIFASAVNIALALTIGWQVLQRRWPIGWMATWIIVSVAMALLYVGMFAVTDNTYP